MVKFNCYLVVISLLITQQIAAIDLARLYGHEGHELQKRSGNYPQTPFFHVMYRHNIMLLNARNYFPHLITFLSLLYAIWTVRSSLLLKFINKFITRRKWEKEMTHSRNIETKIISLIVYIQWDDVAFLLYYIYNHF